uniref:D-isomer specific 2-hydroxyacid dehydrogenase catalytic domain-containing protein n=1 Tax=Glossina palpalis gambiensis TaxID=67801 RepID=A0A1B0BCQ2_9MUSC
MIYKNSLKIHHFKPIKLNDNFPISGIVLTRLFDVSVWNKCELVPREEWLKQIAGKSALHCTITDKIDNGVIIGAGSQLKCITMFSVGYDHIDLDACKKLWARVGYAPDVVTNATTEFTMALLLASGRRMFEANRDVYSGWKS